MSYIIDKIIDFIIQQVLSAICNIIFTSKKHKKNKPAIEQDEEITNLVYDNSDNKAYNYIKR